jgi:hypothetical protein
MEITFDGAVCGRPEPGVSRLPGGIQDDLAKIGTLEFRIFECQHIVVHGAKCAIRPMRHTVMKAMDLLYGKWLNPLLALIACYELIRRGSVNEKSREIQEVLQNMRTYFSGLPDTEVIAMLLDQEYRPLNSPPLLMDGVLAVSGKDIFPLPESKLDYDGIWTTWRSAVTVAVRAPMLAR